MVDQVLLERLVREIEPTRGALPGWCTSDKAYKIMELILGEHIQQCVEIGVFGGSSLIPMAVAVKAGGVGKVIGIDPWNNDAMLDGLIPQNHRDWWGAINLQDIKKACYAAIQKFNVGQFVTIIEDKAENVNDLKDIEFLHIDGNHSEASIYQYVEKFLPLVKSGGIIAINDIFWEENKVVTPRKGILKALENKTCERICIAADCIFLKKR